MLDRRPVARAPGVAATDVRRRRPSGWAAPVDVADEAVALQPGLVSLRAVGGIGPHAGAGAGGIEEGFAQEPAVVAAGVGDVPAADQPEPPVNAGVSLVAARAVRSHVPHAGKVHRVRSDWAGEVGPGGISRRMPPDRERARLQEARSRATPTPRTPTGLAHPDEAPGPHRVRSVQYRCSRLGQSITARRLQPARQFPGHR